MKHADLRYGKLYTVLLGGQKRVVQFEGTKQTKEQGTSYLCRCQQTGLKVALKSARKFQPIKGK